MKKAIIILGALLLGIGGAMAADRERAREFFQQLDSNGDRRIQFTEIQTARARLFDRLDTNQNGFLDTDEAQMALERAKSHRRDPISMQLTDLETRAAAMDGNGDGSISRDEFTGFIPERLLKANTDGDHALSLRELRSLRRQ